MQTALAAGMTENVEAGVPREGFVAGERGVPRLLVALPFVGGISLATFLFAYLASRFIHEAIEAAGTPGAGWLAVFVPVLLAVITVLGGLRWTVLFAFSFAAFQQANSQVRSLEMAAGFDLRAGLQRGGEHRGSGGSSRCLCSITPATR